MIHTAKAGIFLVLNSKEEIRKKILAVRANLSCVDVATQSNLIQQKILKTDWFRKASLLGFYYPIRQEVEIWRLFEMALEQKKKAFFPRVTASGLSFYQVTSRDDFIPGPWGTWEPKSGEEFPLSQIESIFVPGVGFDLSANRLGFGKGFYDRVLRECPGFKIGLAYDFQIMHEIPREGQDVPCDAVVTEKRVICRRGS